MQLEHIDNQSLIFLPLSKHTLRLQSISCKNLVKLSTSKWLWVQKNSYRCNSICQEKKLKLKIWIEYGLKLKRTGKQGKDNKSIILTCQKIKLVLMVWETASFPHVSRLSFRNTYNITKYYILSHFKPREQSKYFLVLTRAKREDSNNTICELNSLVDCKFTRSHLSSTDAAAFA